VISELDHVRLVSLLDRLEDGRLHDTVQDAHDLFDTIITVPGQSISPDIVTMRTRLRLRGDDAQERDLSLVYPDEADVVDGRISVLSPLGLSLLGCRKGQTIQWQGPDRIRHEGVIADILYQPEAAGDYNK